MEYLHWDEKTILNPSPDNIAKMYDQGYVFTRIGKGVMQQTRSCRIDMSKFELSSENRRILRKTEEITLKGYEMKKFTGYDISIGKMAKDFYDTKFAKGIMSAQKVKEMITDAEKSNFNCLLTYLVGNNEKPDGYCICYTSDILHHYSYPFYNLKNAPENMGMGMLLKCILLCKELGHKYVYLGSLQRPTDTYKLQFTGLEWFDGKKWQTNIEEVKKLLK